MKLLGWMHRKFRQNSGEPLKDFFIGQHALDDQQYITKRHIKPFKQAQGDQDRRKSFTYLEATRVEEEGEDEEYEEESSVSISEIFHGFLAIGTLGSDQITKDPLTPKFSISVENITEKDTEVTENELKLINDELEKVLGAEANDDSSARNSQVSNGRSSHGSTITLSGKPFDGPESNVCPLQGYLFGSAIEFSETTTVAKKEHRPSLGELFQKTKLAEENSRAKCDKEEKRAEKEVDKSAMHLMKKILKKRVLHAEEKILHMFHRKVHPENTSTVKKSDKHQKNEKKKKTAHDENWISGDQILPDEDIMIYPQSAFAKQNLRNYKTQSNPPQFIMRSIDSNGNGEHWIKTDADYLVLEL